MKRAIISGERRAGLEEVPNLTPLNDQVVIKIHAAPMCAEYKAFVSGESQKVMGHEAAGEVVAVAQPGPVAVGDRVVVMPLVGCGECALCRSGDYIHCPKAFELSGFVDTLPGCDTMAQYLLKPAWLLKKIPDGLSYEHAALSCCALGPSFGAFQLMEVAASDTLLITGAGPVGLGAIVNARYRGARVVVVESVPYRAQRALELGAETVLNPGDTEALATIQSLTNGLGVDCALECSGNVHAERLCIDAARRKGKIAFIGECYDDLAIKISPDMIRKGLRLYGSWHYNLNDYPKVIEVILNSPLIDRLISHVVPMSRIQEAFELSASRNTAKVILKPWE